MKSMHSNGFSTFKGLDLEAYELSHLKEMYQCLTARVVICVGAEDNTAYSGLPDADCRLCRARPVFRWKRS